MYSCPETICRWFTSSLSVLKSHFPFRKHEPNKNKHIGDRGSLTKVTRKWREGYVCLTETIVTDGSNARVSPSSPHNPKISFYCRSKKMRQMEPDLHAHSTVLQPDSAKKKKKLVHGKRLLLCYYTWRLFLQLPMQSHDSRAVRVAIDKFHVATGFAMLRKYKLTQLFLQIALQLFVVKQVAEETAQCFLQLSSKRRCELGEKLPHVTGPLHRLNSLLVVISHCF